MTQIMVPLDALRFGHEAEPPINARKTGRLDDIEEYAASLQAHGLIQALNVRLIGNQHFVEDGNKRLAAYRLLAERGAIPIDMKIKCDPNREPAADSKERSMAANFIRAPLHDADACEEFKALHSSGMPAAKIAERFGLEVARVDRFLALGDLSPVLMQAWREDSLGNQRFAILQAFTMAPSHAEQERVFEELTKLDRLYPNAVRAAFGFDKKNEEAAMCVKIVGVDAYKAAGGAITMDLFGDKHIIADADLAKRLADEWTEAKLKELIADGWSWAAFHTSLAASWSYMWQRLEADGKPSRAEKKRIKQLQAIIDKPGGTKEAEEDAQRELEEIEERAKSRGWSPDQKASAGAVLEIHAGNPTIHYGVVKPAPAKQTAAAAKSAAKMSRTDDDEDDGNADNDNGAIPSEPVEPSTISNAIAERLSVQAIQATRLAIVAEPRLGLVALLTAFLSGGSSGYPIRVRHEGFGFRQGRTVQSWDDTFQRLLGMDHEELFRVAGQVAAMAIDMQVFNSAALPFAGPNGTLVNTIDPKLMGPALVQAFDAQDYFKSVPKVVSVAAVKEALGDLEARKADKLLKPDLVAYCVTNLPGTGWLPPQLRTAHYDGPGAAK